MNLHSVHNGFRNFTCTEKRDFSTVRTLQCEYVQELLHLHIIILKLKNLNWCIVILFFIEDRRSYLNFN